MSKERFQVNVDNKSKLEKVSRTGMLAVFGVGVAASVLGLGAVAFAAAVKVASFKIVDDEIFKRISQKR